MPNKDKELPSDQMTSADYYFDSYAHFGKKSCTISRNTSFVWGFGMS